MPDVLLVGVKTDSLEHLDAVVGQDEADWSVYKIATAQAALEHLDSRPAAVVVAALGNEPGLYQQFFSEVTAVSPRTIRFALISNVAALDRIMYAHQILAARHDMGYVMPILKAAAEVAERADEHSALRHIVSHLHDVPSPPTLYFDIREQIELLAGDLTGMAEATAKDPSLVARILKIANSGFYGVPRSISSLSEAVGLIGTDALLGMVLAAHLYSGLPPPGIKLEILWQHNLRVSALAKQIAKLEGGSHTDQSACSIAGLLHDIGIMILLENEPARYQPIWCSSGGDEHMLAELERDAFGVTHGELGALILRLWSLPDPVVDAVAQSHTLELPDGTQLSLTSRAVVAAEWLLDDTRARDVPGVLSGAEPDTMQQWQQMRDAVVNQSLPF